MIEVIKPGLQTTVQDSGRPGYQSFGVSVAGAEDNFSFRVANLLVGNRIGSPFLMDGERGDAGFEFLLKGPVLRFAVDALIALTGAGSEPTLDGIPIPSWEAVPVRAGGILNTGIARTGIRGYLAIA